MLHDVSVILSLSEESEYVSTIAFAYVHRSFTTFRMTETVRVLFHKGLYMRNLNKKATRATLEGSCSSSYHNDKK